MHSNSETCFSGSDPYLPPDGNEIEISLFGPGYGESVLLHFGDNNWFLADSCIEPLTKEPAPLSYLRKIGINPTEAIRVIVASHWHDDHIRGLGKVFRECKMAQFVCSGALRSEEFLTLVYALGKRSMMETSGVLEFYDILNTLQQRLLSNRDYRSSLKLALADRVMWKKCISFAGLNWPCEIYSLSPSDSSTILALLEIGHLLPLEGQAKIRAVPTSPNHISVVLWIRIGKIYVLLGSDLQETPDLNTGWSVIVDSDTRPQEKSSVLKIPHHGSKKSYNPKVWANMLEPNPISILTPFALGRVNLPTQADIKRILKHTQKAYVTANATRKRTRKRPKIVEKTIRESVKNFTEVSISSGHVRLRTKDIEPPMAWEVTLLGGAIHLDKFTPVK